MFALPDVEAQSSRENGVGKKDTTILTATYYVDSETGDDAHDGVSAAAAWKTLDNVNARTFGPGAAILFKSGGRWTGELTPQGSGGPGNPIVIDQYGAGHKPVIHGTGKAYTLLLDNQQYWEISNLEITNYDASEEGTDLATWEANNISDWAAVDNPPQYTIARSNKSGILIKAVDMGEVNHIHLKHLEVHGVNGNVMDKDNGGIFVEISGSVTPTYFKDLLIEGCHIHDVDRTGISNKSSWETRTLTANTNWTPSRDVIIRNNTFERTGANALIVRVADQPLIEHNLFDHCGIKQTGNAGFNFNTDRALWQYNEARFTQYNEGDEDAGGFDSDFRTKNTIMQYNYSHDNDFGLLLTGGAARWGGFNDSTIIRYNIFENDGNYVIKLSGQATHAIIHNNIFYIGSSQDSVMVSYHKNWGAWPAHTAYYNNIIYNKGSHTTYHLGSSTNNTYSNNLYFGKPVTNEPPDPHKITGNPRLRHPGGGEEGYHIDARSPAIGKGIAVPGRPDKDYYGHEILPNTRMDIGVHQYSQTLNTEGLKSKKK